jgi:hypothetical protein
MGVAENQKSERASGDAGQLWYVLRERQISKKQIAYAA